MLIEYGNSEEVERNRKATLYLFLIKQLISYFYIEL